MKAAIYSSVAALFLTVPCLAAPPSAPQKVLTKRQKDVGVVVTWVGGSPDSEAFVVERGTDGREFKELAAVPNGINAYLDQTAQPGVAYVYRVRARRGGETSAPAPGVLDAPEFKLMSPKDGKTTDTTAPKLEWNALPGADRYDVTVANPERKTPVITRSTTSPSLEIPSGTLSVNTDYKWNVIANTPAGAFPASEDGNSFTTPGVLKWFKDHHLSLKRAFEGDDSAEGASFTLDRKATAAADAGTGRRNTSHEQDTSVRLALIYARPLSRHFLKSKDDALSFISAIELKLVNDDFDVNDAIRFRVGFGYDFLLPANKWISGFSQTLALKYEADQDFDNQQLVAEWLVSPTNAAFGMGQPRDLFKKHRGAAMLYFRPYFGVDFGHALDDLEGMQDTILRYVGRIKVKIYFPNLAHDLGLHDISLYADETVRWLPGHTPEDFHSYLESGLEFELTDEVTLDLTYKIGEDSPDFEKIDALGLSVGFKF